MRRLPQQVRVRSAAQALALWIFMGSPLRSIATTVEHVFEVTYFGANPDHNGDTLIQGINGSVHGPEIRVQRGDTLSVTILNRLAVESLSIHWHGFEMRAAQEYDGAMGITQCGIKPMTDFVYNFVVDELPGTYQYHEHGDLDSVATRGLFGPLVVEEPPESPKLSMYSQDVVILLQEHSKRSPKKDDLYKMAGLIRPVSVSGVENAVGLVEFNNLLINGKGGFNVFSRHTDFQISYLEHLTPQAGETWRLRLINAGNLFAMRFRIDLHRLTVIQTDGADVEPYECDAITMSSGERFDVLVTFDQTPGSYWFRVETLEEQPALGIHHGQLGVLRYQGTPADVEPELGYPRRSRIWEVPGPGLVTLNCVDQENTYSPTCRPLTDLRRHPSVVEAHVGSAGDVLHEFEVSLRAFNPTVFPAHFARVIDLSTGNPHGENQFDGEYVQFAAPVVPYSWQNGSYSQVHPNTLEMHVSLGETIRVIIQHQDRAAHPWHLHGHKFAVLAVGFPDYRETCDVVYCRSQVNHWISRDGYPELLDPAVAPLKDTVHLPAGGWAVIQFKADNPGWWFFHCHMAIHAHDGMALVLVEAPEQIPGHLKNPQGLKNPAYLTQAGFPSCDTQFEKLEKDGPGVSCNCWESPEMKIDNMPRATYKCSHWYTCAHILGLNPQDPPYESHVGGRKREEGRRWRIVMMLVEFCVVLLLFLAKWIIREQHSVVHRSELEEIATPTVNPTWIKERAVKELKHAHSNLTPSMLLQKSVSKDHMSIGDTVSSKVSTAVHIEPSAVVQAHDGNELDMSFSARVVEGDTMLPPVKGLFKSGSLVLLLGLEKVSPMWLRFFARRRLEHTGACVVGNITLGSTTAAQWDPRKFRQKVCYLDPRVNFGRPNIQLLLFLNYFSHMGHDTTLHTTADHRNKHRDLIIKIFQLTRWLSTRMEDLPPEVATRAAIAIELLVPRSVLIIEDPLNRMDRTDRKSVV